MSSSGARTAATKEFRDITQASDRQAQQVLRDSGWNVARATETWFSRGMVPQGGKTVDVGAIRASYDKYATTEVETNVGGVSERATIMSEEGFEALCKDVGIDPYADAFALQILHAMAAEDPSNISFDQFRRGMVSMQASNAAELKSRRAKLEADVRSDRKTFLRFWAHAFVANREPGMKVVSVDVVKGLLAMLSPDWALLVEFEAFLDTKKVVSLDTWKQLLRFQREVKPDLSGYEDDMSWPTTIDEFVVFVNKRRGGAGADAGAAAGGGGK